METVDKGKPVDENFDRIRAAASVSAQDIQDYARTAMNEMLSWYGYAKRTNIKEEQDVEQSNDVTSMTSSVQRPSSADVTTRCHGNATRCDDVTNANNDRSLTDDNRGMKEESENETVHAETVNTSHKPTPSCRQKMESTGLTSDFSDVLEKHGRLACTIVSLREKIWDSKFEDPPSRSDFVSDSQLCSAEHTQKFNTQYWQGSDFDEGNEQEQMNESLPLLNDSLVNDDSEDDDDIRSSADDVINPSQSKPWRTEDVAPAGDGTRICDWCKSTVAAISCKESLNGLQELNFCSELCLNQYKMNLFCLETQQHLQQIEKQTQEPGDDSSSSLCCSAQSSKEDVEFLITPALWLKGTDGDSADLTRGPSKKVKMSHDISAHLRQAKKDQEASNDDVMNLKRKGSDVQISQKEENSSRMMKRVLDQESQRAEAAKMRRVSKAGSSARERMCSPADSYTESERWDQQRDGAKDLRHSHSPSESPSLRPSPSSSTSSRADDVRGQDGGCSINSNQSRMLQNFADSIAPSNLRSSYPLNSPSPSSYHRERFHSSSSSSYKPQFEANTETSRSRGALENIRDKISGEIYSERGQKAVSPPSTSFDAAGGKYANGKAVDGVDLKVIKTKKSPESDTHQGRSTHPFAAALTGGIPNLFSSAALDPALFSQLLHPAFNMQHGASPFWSNPQLFQNQLQGYFNPLRYPSNLLGLNSPTGASAVAAASAGLQNPNPPTVVPLINQAPPPPLPVQAQASQNVRPLLSEPQKSNGSTGFTDSLSSILPPSTLMVPYPILIPIPLPIPLPFPVPENFIRKANKTKSSPEPVQENFNKETSLSNEFISACLNSICNQATMNEILKHSVRAKPDNLGEKVSTLKPKHNDVTIASSSRYPQSRDDDDAALDFSVGKRNTDSAVSCSAALPNDIRDKLGFLSSISRLVSPQISKDGVALSEGGYAVIKSEPTSSITDEPISSPHLAGLYPHALGLAPSLAQSMLSAPHLPYSARRSLILDAPSVPAGGCGDRRTSSPVTTRERQGSTRKFVPYCGSKKRSHTTSNVVQSHVKTK